VTRNDVDHAVHGRITTKKKGGGQKLPEEKTMVRLSYAIKKRRDLLGRKRYAKQPEESHARKPLYNCEGGGRKNLPAKV